MTRRARLRSNRRVLNPAKRNFSHVYPHVLIIKVIIFLCQVFQTAEQSPPSHNISGHHIYPESPVSVFCIGQIVLDFLKPMPFPIRLVYRFPARDADLKIQYPLTVLLLIQYRLSNSDISKVILRIKLNHFYSQLGTPRMSHKIDFLGVETSFQILG